MIALIDLDGVLVDFNLGFSRLLKPYPVPYLDDNFPVCWNWPEHYGVPKEAIDRAWVEATNSGNFWRHLPPYPTAWRDIQKIVGLSGEGHTFYFVTNRLGKTAKLESEDWLWSHGIDKATVIVTAQKGLIGQAVGADLVVDDLIPNLDGHPGKTVRCLLNRPYNQGNVGQLKRVSSVREALEIVGL